MRERIWLVTLTYKGTVKDAVIVKNDSVDDTLAADYGFDYWNEVPQDYLIGTKLLNPNEKTDR